MTGLIGSEFQNVNPFTARELSDMAEICWSFHRCENTDDMNYNRWAITALMADFERAGVKAPALLVRLKKERELLFQRLEVLEAISSDLYKDLDANKISEEEFNLGENVILDEEIARYKELYVLWMRLAEVFCAMKS